ncbi:MAG: hypothetical protein JEZ04_19030 [Spirochaetales bacterium]|nr:hypothetical protein [Spirochaetales bacterium]
MTLTSLKQVRVDLTAKWEKGGFLRALVTGDVLFPFEFSLKSPAPLQLSERFNEVRIWVQEIKAGCEKAGIRLEWRNINHRQLGRNSIPNRVVFDDLPQLADFTGKKAELRRFETSLRHISASYPQLSVWAGAHPFDLIGCSGQLDRLLSIVLWIKNNPRPGIYLRQLSLPGVDTKFIEKNRKLLSQWLDIILEPQFIDERYQGVAKFEPRYGFLQRPGLVRFRILAPGRTINGFSDMTVPATEFARWKPDLKCVFIVENDITALSFPDADDSLLIFGRGYNFNELAAAHWLNEKELWYWGDIDTHGFAILSQFRGIFPRVRSFLMDRETLMNHRAHWGAEPKQVAAEALPNLTKEEAALYADLKNDVILSGLRLEQEFINFSFLKKFLE